MGLFAKLFCHHKWDSHVIKEHNNKYLQELPRDYFEGWKDKPKYTEVNKSYTHEVLICNRCGKIKHIVY